MLLLKERLEALREEQMAKGEKPRLTVAAATVMSITLMMSRVSYFC